LNIRVIEKYSTGDIIQIGPFEGQIAKQNSLIIDGDVEPIIDLIKKEILPIYPEVVDDLNLCVLAKYDGECNIEIPHNVLLKFAELNLPLNLTCYSK
jgi:hypothetical protein